MITKTLKLSELNTNWSAHYHLDIVANTEKLIREYSSIENQHLYAYVNPKKLMEKLNSQETIWLNFILKKQKRFDEIRRIVGDTAWKIC